MTLKLPLSPETINWADIQIIVIISTFCIYSLFCGHTPTGIWYSFRNYSSSEVKWGVFAPFSDWCETKKKKVLSGTQIKSCHYKAPTTASVLWYKMFIIKRHIYTWCQWIPLGPWKRHLTKPGSPKGGKQLSHQSKAQALLEIPVRESLGRRKLTR